MQLGQVLESLRGQWLVELRIGQAGGTRTEIRWDGTAVDQALAGVPDVMDEGEVERFYMRFRTAAGFGEA